ncbi:MAG: TIGR01212 family radical SAM protein [Planctomycetes bacterium]|nr:TIGR01212 family radical SAM protein [Planctomycetota bacterium]
MERRETADRSRPGEDVALSRWDLDGERYYSFGRYLREQFPFRVRKIGLDAGFTCPNRDGTRGVGGCTFCNNESFSENSGRGAPPSLARQVADGITFYRSRFRAEKFFLYYQAYTNTYAPADRLRAIYGEGLEAGGDDVVGLSIGTRPDCVPDPVLDLVASYSDRYQVWIEYGIQTRNRAALDLMNRGHHWEEFEDAIRRTRLRAPAVRICAHLILGCPGDGPDDALGTVRDVTELGVDGVKLHHLYVSPRTVLARQYERGEVRLLSLEEYVALAADALEELSPRCVVQRLVGDLAGPMVVAPLWGLTRTAIYTRIIGELRRRGTRQGSRFFG